MRGVIGWVCVAIFFGGGMGYALLALYEDLRWSWKNDDRWAIYLTLIICILMAGILWGLAPLVG